METTELDMDSSTVPSSKGPGILRRTPACTGPGDGPVDTVRTGEEPTARILRAIIAASHAVVTVTASLQAGRPAQSYAFAWPLERPWVPEARPLG